MKTDVIMTLSRILLLALIAAALSGVCYGDSDDSTPSDPDVHSDEDTDDDEDEDSFLDPYYESEDSSGCTLDGCFDAGDILRLITAIDVRYNSDPFEHAGVRAVLGKKGNPIAVNIRLGLSGLEDNAGFAAQVILRTPSPLGLDVLYHRVSSGEGSSGFSLLYTGLVTQLLYNSPLQLMFGAQMVFPSGDERETLTGAGFELLGQYLFDDRIGLALDYRLVWIHSLPLQRGELRLSWVSAPIEFFAGYGFMRNSNGDYIKNPCAGVGIFF
jgi:hypothetical protein